MRDQFSMLTMNRVLQEWLDWQQDARDKRSQKKDQIAKRYGSALKVQRARRGISQRALANLLGINVTVVAKIETGVILPSSRIHASTLHVLRSTPEVITKRKLPREAQQIG